MRFADGVFLPVSPDPTLIALGLVVGTIVGITGVGGGALLTPLLILIAGVRPTVAIGTDLAFAAITKSFGSWQHARHGGVDGRLTFRLACGSVPGALVGVRLIGIIQSAQDIDAEVLVGHILGVALVLAAVANLVRAAGVSWTVGGLDTPGPVAGGILGFVVGLLVGLTSIGAGSLLMAVFALLYGLPARRAVGSDVLHGAIMAAVAALAHSTLGRVEVPMLASLLVGSVPGVLIGSSLCGRLPNRPLRVGIAVILAVSGVRLL